MVRSAEIANPAPEAERADLEDAGEPTAEPERWLEQHGTALYKFAMLRLRDPHSAEDVVQETLLKAINAFSSFRGDATIRTWLFAILRNEISRHVKVKQRRETKTQTSESRGPLALDQLLSPQVGNRQFASAVEREEFWDVIQQCYEKLPDHLLDTFLFRLSNPQEKIEDLCCDLEITESNLSVRLYRARLMLRHCLERAWLDD